MKKYLIIVLLVLFFIPKSFFTAGALTAEEWSNAKKQEEMYIIETSNTDRTVSAENLCDKITLKTKIDIDIGLVKFSDKKKSDFLIVRLLTLSGKDGLILTFFNDNNNDEQIGMLTAEYKSGKESLLQEAMIKYSLKSKITQIAIGIEFLNDCYLIKVTTSIKSESEELKYKEEELEVDAAGMIDKEAKLSVGLKSGEELPWNPIIKIVKTILHIQSEQPNVQEGPASGQEPTGEVEDGFKKQIVGNDDKTPLYPIIIAGSGACLLAITIFLIIRNKKRRI